MKSIDLIGFFSTVIAEHGDDARFSAAVRVVLDLLDVERSEDRALSVLLVLLPHFEKELVNALHDDDRCCRVHETGSHVYVARRSPKSDGGQSQGERFTISATKEEAEAALRFLVPGKRHGPFARSTLNRIAMRGDYPTLMRRLARLMAEASPSQWDKPSPKGW